MIDLEEIALRAVNHFGTEHQKQKAIEELGELISEIAREQDYRSSNWTIAGEVADVLITAYQLRIIVGADKVDKMIRVKCERLLSRIYKESTVKSVKRLMFEPDLSEFTETVGEDQTEETECTDTCPIDFAKIEADLANQGEE